MKILYICMPYAPVNWGSLALGTLKAVGETQGLEADICYLNLDFAQQIGVSQYNKLAEMMEGELCFTSSLFPEINPYDLWENYLQLQTPGQLGEEQIRLLKFREGFLDIATQKVPEFLEKALSTISWESYDIIGFTTGFNQTIPALSLSRYIRIKFAEKIIILGGAACREEAGKALLEGFDFLDIVVDGEADALIVPLLRAIRNREPVDQWKQVSARASRRIRTLQVESSFISIPPVKLNQLPVPNFNDFFLQRQQLSLASPVAVPFESSRGCWWGQKNPCAFCGLNGRQHAYRSKSAERVLSEIQIQYGRYAECHFIATDNILNPAYFGTCIKDLAKMHKLHGLTFFYEVRTDLTIEQLKALKQAGIIHIQAGIESLNDHVLELMSKGVTGLNQIRFLRDIAATGLNLSYNLLWGNPGETVEDLYQLRDLIPSIAHLPPPKRISPIRLERFSRYFKDPGKYGIYDISIPPMLYLVFGKRNLDYHRISPFFNFKHKQDDDQNLSRAYQQYIEAVKKWQTEYIPGTFIGSTIDDFLYIIDKRRQEVTISKHQGSEGEILSLCQNPCTLLDLKQSRTLQTKKGLHTVLDKLVSKNLLLAWKKKTGKKEESYLYLSTIGMLPADEFFNEHLQPLLKQKVH